MAIKRPAQSVLNEQDYAADSSSAPQNDKQSSKIIEVA